MMNWDKHRYFGGKAIDLVFAAMDETFKDVPRGDPEIIKDILESIERIQPIESRQAATVAIVMARWISYEIQIRRSMT